MQGIVYMRLLHPSISQSVSHKSVTAAIVVSDYNLQTPTVSCPHTCRGCDRLVRCTARRSRPGSRSGLSAFGDEDIERPWRQLEGAAEDLQCEAGARRSPQRPNGTDAACL